MHMAASLCTWHSTVKRHLVPLSPFGCLHPLTHPSRVRGRAHADRKLGAATRLLEAGASVDVADKTGMRPLHVAAADGAADGARVCLAAGASVHAADASGATALHHAARYGHTTIARVLLAAGASARVAGPGGLTPHSIAARAGHAELRTLLEAGHRPVGREGEMVSALSGTWAVLLMVAALTAAAAFALRARRRMRATAGATRAAPAETTRAQDAHSKSKRK